MDTRVLRDVTGTESRNARDNATSGMGVVVFFFATDPNGRPMADRDATGAMSNCLCAWPWQLLFAVHHSRDRSRTAIDAAVHVGGCVGQNVDVPVFQSAEQIVDDPKEHVVDVPVLEFHEGVAEQIEDFTVPAIKEELAEAAASGALPRARLGGDSVTPVPQIKENIAVVWQALLQEDFHEDIVEQTDALIVPQLKEKITGACQALLQELIHEHIVEPSIPRSAVVGSGKRVKWRRSVIFGGIQRCLSSSPAASSLFHTVMTCFDCDSVGGFL